VLRTIMADIAYLVLTLTFFAVAIGYVVACDRII
jgi:hypothetical protein